MRRSGRVVPRRMALPYNRWIRRRRTHAIRKKRVPECFRLSELCRWLVRFLRERVVWLLLYRASTLADRRHCRARLAQSRMAWASLAARFHRTPHARSEPGSLCVHGIAVQGASDGEQSERIAGSFSFVHVSRVQRHGNGISLVGGRIPELPVDQNRDRNERRSCRSARVAATASARGPASFFFAALRSPGSDLRTFLLRRNRLRQDGHAAASPAAAPRYKILRCKILGKQLDLFLPACPALDFGFARRNSHEGQ